MSSKKGATLTDYEILMIVISIIGIVLISKNDHKK
ncbi:hypothetical protein MXL97_10165 [Mammaliicoccus fleurettii]|nr:hypothetical protein [Mammaliicoccus fleurettii]MEB6202163.1 hypothetical protein [Mammaliicoccus fleurettii]MEB7778917.1 hypothetical protein [Mammaliicoccus fleurettii]